MDYEMAVDVWLDSYWEDRLGGGGGGYEREDIWDDAYDDYDADYEDCEW